MNTLAQFQRRLGWINLPGLLLMMLLQRLPAVSVVVASEEMVIATPVGALLRSAVAAVAALGAVNTMVGATPLVPTSGTATGITVNVGASVSVFYTVNGTQTPPMSWQITGNIPPGLNFSGLTSAGSVNVGSLHLAGTPTTGGTYNLTLQTFEFANNGGDSSPIYAYTITVNGGPANTAPSFTMQPSSQTVTAGDPVTFTAGASGTPTPTYQWRKNGADIGGATGSSFSIASASGGDAGDYSVVATNSEGSVTSNTATLTVNASLSPPSFTMQPNSQTVPAGSGVTFSATASGNPTPTYQWRKNGNDIGGATGSSYSIGSVSMDDAGTYTVVATNSQGTATSNAATLTVGAALTVPSITLNPVSQLARSGTSVSFTAAADGNPTPTLQWRKNGIAINGATGTSLTIPALSLNDAGTYSVVATNSQGSVASGSATLTVHSAKNTDFLSQNAVTGERAIRYPNGSSLVVAASLGTAPAGAIIAGADDFNADGNSDILWQNTYTGERYVWFMNGTDHVGTASLGIVPVAWSIVATADFNSDGKPDLLWQNTSTGERYVWFMNGTDHVADVSLGVVPVEWSIATAADFNGDGKPDILWQNTSTGERYLWFMNGTAHVGDAGLGLVPVEWAIATTVDFNGDGKTDILWQNTSARQCYVWLMDGANHIGDADLGTLPQDWSLAGVPMPPAPPATTNYDFNGDGQTDILWQNTTSGERYLWFMNGSTHVSDVSLGVVPLAWSIASAADFNGDGKPDILWQNTATGERYLWFMNGGTHVSDISLGVVPLAWSIATTADFNGDGKPDILWQNTTTGERYIWFMNGSTHVSDVSLGVVPLVWSIASAADFNGDGKPDILWQNTATGERYVWFMNGSTHVSDVSLGVVPLAWSIANAADFNGDGKADILWQNTVSGERYLWFMNDTTHASDTSLGVVPVQWSIRD